MTGAPVPASADTIVPLEQFHEPTQQLPSQITFDAVPVPDKNIRRRAEDTLAGAIVAVAGTVLTHNILGPSQPPVSTRCLLHVVLGGDYFYRR